MLDISYLQQVIKLILQRQLISIATATVHITATIATAIVHISATIATAIVHLSATSEYKI